MKKLFIVRHGKSAWDLDVRDHDRVLKQRGIDDAHMIGNAIQELKIVPDKILSSTAARALQTATIVSEYMDYDLHRFELRRNLYTFNSNDLLTQVHQFDDSWTTVMFFSHNHGLTDLANKLGSTYFDNVPTTGLVQLEFAVDSWSEVNSGTTVMKIFPKDIK
jgi:phosphohistidine phosphatase